MSAETTIFTQPPLCVTNAAGITSAPMLGGSIRAGEDFDQKTGCSAPIYRHSRSPSGRQKASPGNAAHHPRRLPNIPVCRSERVWDGQIELVGVDDEPGITDPRRTPHRHVGFPPRPLGSSRWGLGRRSRQGRDRGEANLVLTRSRRCLRRRSARVVNIERPPRTPSRSAPASPSSTAVDEGRGLRSIPLPIGRPDEDHHVLHCEESPDPKNAGAGHCRRLCLCDPRTVSAGKMRKRPRCGSDDREIRRNRLGSRRDFPPCNSFLVLTRVFEELRSRSGRRARRRGWGESGKIPSRRACCWSSD